MRSTGSPAFWAMRRIMVLFAAAGPAFDEIQLNARFCAELLKIATEAPRPTAPKKEIHTFLSFSMVNTLSLPMLCQENFIRHTARKYLLLILYGNNWKGAKRNDSFCAGTAVYGGVCGVGSMWVGEK